MDTVLKMWGCWHPDKGTKMVTTHITSEPRQSQLIQTSASATEVEGKGDAVLARGDSSPSSDLPKGAELLKYSLARGTLWQTEVTSSRSHKKAERNLRVSLKNKFMHGIHFDDYLLQEGDGAFERVYTEVPGQKQNSTELSTVEIKCPQLHANTSGHEQARTLYLGNSRLREQGHEWKFVDDDSQSKNMSTSPERVSSPPIFEWKKGSEELARQRDMILRPVKPVLRRQDG